MNSFFHSNVLSNPSYRSGGSPNCDTLYSTAWVDLAKEPLVLSVLEITRPLLQHRRWRVSIPTSASPMSARGRPAPRRATT